MNHNEQFVSHLFDRMVQLKPSLAKFLASDDDFMDAEETDYRELSNVITKEFPWPIGVELRRLLSGSMTNLNRGRLDQILKTYERTLQFLSFILVINLYEEALKNKLTISDAFKNEFQRRFTLLTLGNYVWMVDAIGKVFKENQLSFFVEEMEGIFSKKFIKASTLLVEDRNNLSHYLVNLTDDDIELKCVETFNKLKELLCDVAFLINYPLVTIPQITVNNPRNSEVSFTHQMMLLNSASSSFYGTEKVYNNYANSPSVLLVKDRKELPNQSLNLSPLIIDTHFEPIDSPEKKLKVKKDVLLYSKFDSKSCNVRYVGTEAIEKPDVSVLSFYEGLKTEVNDIFQKIAY